jgi:hypothetical protein
MYVIAVIAKHSGDEHSMSGKQLTVRLGKDIDYSVPGMSKVGP